MRGWECSLRLPTWKYLPHTRHAYTFTGLSDTEQHFSKSKSRFWTAPHNAHRSVPSVGQQ